MSHVVDVITEHQRRQSNALNGNIAPSGVTHALHVDPDSQYDKKYLLDRDPSPWADSDGKTCTPGSVPIQEGYAILKPWVYMIDAPRTDAGGWIYKKDFSDPTESATNTHACMVRFRKWRRVCCTLAEKEEVDKEEAAMMQQIEENQRVRQESEEAEAAAAAGREEKKWYPGKFIKKAVDAVVHK